ncbi:hypothetical protein CC80DRAFT_598363 [Byssothecium circinans]|uniref:Uncharacterized protein n=1 Tax=Byssothecium circinans TaxID=147558 RepID=A0A6A5TBD6_9PLEO|nr:hypothetical protein CC80DRAFT_598363 [Byssothecium circinans]
MDIEVTLAEVSHIAFTRFPDPYGSLPTHEDILFFDISGAAGLLIGRLVINLNGKMKVVRDIYALLSSSGSGVGVGFTNGRDFVDIKTWDTIGVQFCAPFSLLDKKDAHFKPKLENFIKLCFLIGVKRRSVVVGLEFMMDVKEIAEDVGWNWKMWRENGGQGAAQFVRETRAADQALVKERERKASIKAYEEQKAMVKAYNEDDDDHLVGWREMRGRSMDGIGTATSSSSPKHPLRRKSPVKGLRNDDSMYMADEANDDGPSEIQKLQQHLRGLRLARDKKREDEESLG